MLGAGGLHVKDCLKNNYIGVDFLKDENILDFPNSDEGAWRQHFIQRYLDVYPEKSIGTARNSIGFLWTVCYGLRIGDIILTPNGEGGYCVAEIAGNYYYAQGENLPHRRSVEWLDVVIPRTSMSSALQHSTGSIGTCSNITKYSDELEALITGTNHATCVSINTPEAASEHYKERSLHKLFADYLLSRNIFPKTIYHENSRRADQAQKWVHPDMVGVEYKDFQTATRSLLKSAETKEYVDLYSFELKRSIENDHGLKEAFFQALSNSSWANYGYLVAFEINEEVMEEMARLNRAFGIGVIQLSAYRDGTKELFPARENKLDYYTIDKLCKINPDFCEFLTRATRVLNAQDDVLKDIKEGLRKFCDKGFSSQEEGVAYCRDSHIPLKD